jgi:hypothetical protein
MTVIAGARQRRPTAQNLVVPAENEDAKIEIVYTGDQRLYRRSRRRKKTGRRPDRAIDFITKGMFDRVCNIQAF